MDRPRYLTKSRFKAALECPGKLYYYDKMNDYPGNLDDNDFMAALAEGGFQVGELAKCYHPGGVDITTVDIKESLKQTNDLLTRENVTIFEAAVQFENLFIRVDVLEKIGNHFNLIEVKAKSIDPGEDNFLAKRGGYISKSWMPYLNDVAFQAWVMEKAFPDCTIEPYLMLADKSKVASVDGLNQHFLLKKENRRTRVKIKGDVTLDALGEPVLIKTAVTHLVQKIWNGQDRPPDKKSAEEIKPFAERIKEYSGYYQRDEKYPVSLGRKCKVCEYHINPSILEPGQKSGFQECWREKLGWVEEHFNKPHIFDIWNYRNNETCIADGIYLMEDLHLEEEFMRVDKQGHLDYKSKTSERQCLQITKALHPENGTEEIDPGLYSEMNKWQYPLHFIDFETSMVAIPFNKGRHPYEQIAFQFSSHTVYEDGTVKHEEWITCEPGKFPNFDFMRALKNVLDRDEGSILRFAAHENTVLRQIHDQIIDARDEGRGILPDDHAELITFIDSITTWKDEDKVKHPGERTMIDMCELVKKHFYHPAMGGSNSIKAVLPAVLQASAFLKEKYSKPQTTTNLGSMVWWQAETNDDTMPLNPYKLLPPLFEEGEFVDDELVLESGYIQEGGAAMTAYAKMQFTEMSDAQRQKIIKGLLTYCELDTLAMVMIWEHWNKNIDVEEEK